MGYQNHGNWRQDDMRKQPFKTASDHWCHMMKPDTQQYKSQKEAPYRHPKDQKAPPHIPEEGPDHKRLVRMGSNVCFPFVLKDYRTQWTTSDANRFAKPQHGW